MKMLFSLLCLFVWTRHTEAAYDQQVTLGQNETLACELNIKVVIWFVMKPLARPLMILRTYGYEKAEYYNESLRSKYSEASRRELKITNVSGDDLGIYYCIKPSWYLEISDGIRLNSAEHRLYTTRSPEDHTEPEQKNLPQVQTTNTILIGILTLLIVVMFATVIGLLVMNHKLSKKIPRTPKYVNGHQIFHMRFRERERRIFSIQTNYDPPPRSRLTDQTYLEVLP